MECLKMNFIRNLELAQDYTFPCQVSGRLWMRPRRQACLHHCSASSREYPKNFSMICITQSVICGHKSSKAFAMPISLGEEPPSLLSEEENTSDADEMVPSDTSEEVLPRKLTSLGEELPSLLSEEENTSDVDEMVPSDTSEEVLPRKLTSDELKALLLDTERSKLLRKLSEANQYNRFLKRQLLIEEDALSKYKNELAVLELELQSLVSLAEEIATNGIQLDSRKINGKYIQSHLLTRLEAVHEKVRKQIKDVDSLKFEEVTLFWVDMAESVQVMGSFDGWTQGEEMSPEYTGDYARFSATLRLRPGRYEIKFLVDGEWQLSPELPTVGEGMTKNNMLVVKKAD